MIVTLRAFLSFENWRIHMSDGYCSEYLLLFQKPLSKRVCRLLVKQLRNIHVHRLWCTFPTLHPRIADITFLSTFLSTVQTTFSRKFLLIYAVLGVTHHGGAHGGANGVEAPASTQVTLDVDGAVSSDGFNVQLDFQNFELVAPVDGLAHVEGQGHGHIYLNGLKLGRVFGDDYELGALKPGSYTLTVGLNANDHRPYLAAGKPIEAVLEFEIP